MMMIGLVLVVGAVGVTLVLIGPIPERWLVIGGIGLAAVGGAVLLAMGMISSAFRDL
jgi:hypothetical protein